MAKKEKISDHTWYMESMERLNKISNGLAVEQFTTIYNFIQRWAKKDS